MALLKIFNNGGVRVTLGGGVKQLSPDTFEVSSSGGKIHLNVASAYITKAALHTCDGDSECGGSIAHPGSTLVVLGGKLYLVTSTFSSVKSAVVYYKNGSRKTVSINKIENLIDPDPNTVDHVKVINSELNCSYCLKVPDIDFSHVPFPFIEPKIVCTDGSCYSFKFEFFGIDEALYILFGSPGYENLTMVAGGEISICYIDKQPTTYTVYGKNFKYTGKLPKCPESQTGGPITP